MANVESVYTNLTILEAINIASEFDDTRLFEVEWAPEYAPGYPTAIDVYAGQGEDAKQLCRQLAEVIKAEGGKTFLEFDKGH